MELSQQTFKPVGMINLEALVTTIPDFPKPGIQFKDINPVLANPAAFKQLIGVMATQVKASGANKIVGLESRGFIFGIAIAQELDLPFVPARKAGKLPGAIIKADYALEYGTQTLEMQQGAISISDRVAVVDDLLATGGTANAAGKLISTLGGKISGYFFAIELSGLNGRSALPNGMTESVMKF